MVWVSRTLPAGPAVNKRWFGVLNLSLHCNENRLTPPLSGCRPSLRSRQPAGCSNDGAEGAVALECVRLHSSVAVPIHLWR